MQQDQCVNAGKVSSDAQSQLQYCRHVVTKSAQQTGAVGGVAVPKSRGLKGDVI
jgi:hypothetical protein